MMALLIPSHYVIRGVCGVWGGVGGVVPDGQGLHRREFFPNLLELLPSFPSQARHRAGRMAAFIGGHEGKRQEKPGIFIFHRGLHPVHTGQGQKEGRLIGSCNSDAKGWVWHGVARMTQWWLSWFCFPPSFSCAFLCVNFIFRQGQSRWSDVVTTSPHPLLTLKLPKLASLANLVLAAIKQGKYEYNPSMVLRTYTRLKSTLGLRACRTVDLWNQSKL